ncbi:hypothetical protein J6590_094356 [Homalodisca vitripennis]|nr:hypothetical protein J6590_094356 [Homalodisca vitripennis]
MMLVWPAVCALRMEERAVFLDIKSEKYVGECETVIGVLGADGVATGPVQTAGNAAVDVEAAGVEGTDVEAADGVVAGVEAGDTDTLAAAGGAARVRGNGVLEGKAWLLYCALCSCVEQVAGDSVDEEVHCAGPIDSICRIVTACAPVCYSLPIDRRVTFASVFMDPPKLLPVRHSHVEPVLRESKRIPSSGNVLMNVPPPRHLACETTVHGGLVHVEPVMRGSKRIPSSGNVLMNVPPPRHLACETTVHGGLVHVEPVMRGSKRIPSSGIWNLMPCQLCCKSFVFQLDIDQDQYFEALIDLFRWENDYTFRQLREVVNRTDWRSHGTVTEVNAFYVPWENSMSK